MVIRNEVAAAPRSDADHGCWYIARTEARRESDVIAALVAAGLEAYAPYGVRFGAQSKFHRRPRKVISPLFPRLIFVRGAPAMAIVDVLHTVRQADGLMCCRSIPLRVRQADVERLQAKEEAGVYDLTLDKIARGPDGLMLLSRVEIIDGPWVYHGGIVKALSGEKGRAVVEMNVFGRDTPIELPVDILRIVI